MHVRMRVSAWRERDGTERAELVFVSWVVIVGNFLSSLPPSLLSFLPPSLSPSLFLFSYRHLFFSWQQAYLTSTIRKKIL